MIVFSLTPGVKVKEPYLEETDPPKLSPRSLEFLKKQDEVSLTRSFSSNSVDDVLLLQEVKAQLRKQSRSSAIINRVLDEIDEDDDDAPLPTKVSVEFSSLPVCFCLRFSFW